MTAWSDRVTDTLVLNSLREPLFVVAPDGTLGYANERLSEITTLPPGELEDSPITELAPFVEAGFDALLEGIDAVRRDGATERRVDVSVVHPEDAPVDGRTPAEARLTRLTDEDGLVGVLVVMRDITDRKETERDLRASERRFRAMFEAHSAPMLLIKPESGRIEEANAAAAEFYGYSTETLAGMTIQRINCLSPSEVAAERRRAQAEDRNHFEFEHELASGEVRPVEVHSSPIEVDDRELLFSIIHDITERKRRQREYEQIFNEVDAAITVHDPADRSMVEVNETMAEWTGYDRSELLAGGVELFSATDQGFTPDRAYDVIEAVADSGHDRTVEWKIETAEGEHRWLEARATTASIGGEQRVLGISRDITERKRRQREYEQIFNGVNDGITVFDPETGEIVDVNDTYYEMLGYEDFDRIRELGIEGLSVTEEGYTAERGKALIRQVADTGDPETVEWRGERKDGERIWIEATLAPVEIKGEERVVSMQRDVTERKRREQEFEQIFNGVQDAIAVHDPDTGEMIEVNDAFCDLLGYDRETVLQLGTAGVSVEEDGYTMERSKAIIREVIDEGQIDPFEWKVETKEGEHRILEVVATTAEIGGETRFLSINRDITERRRREQRLAVFNRILRHNLRNQLDVIRSHAEELADRTADDHAEQIIDATTELATTGERARRIDRIMSRDETPTEIDVAGSLRETIEGIEPGRSDVTVRTELPPEARLRTREKSVTMAVESALENALEHAASAVNVSVENGPDRCIITITDDGPGIPKEELAPIEAGAETRFQHGRGLGLWQLRWCVDTLNGELSFETGGGTTVRITVPDRRESS